MNMCKSGDVKAQIAMRVMYNTEYRNGEFVFNPQSNPAPFIKPVVAQIIE